MFIFSPRLPQPVVTQWDRPTELGADPYAQAEEYYDDQGSLTTCTRVRTKHTKHTLAH